MIHTADPVAFFDPVDSRNERYEELQINPEWSFTGEAFPLFSVLMEELEGLVSSHPHTTFIGAHVGCIAENLAHVAGMLDRCGNYFVDISARIPELGRQPYTAREFFLNHADRILFGLDLGPDIFSYRAAYRFLESGDEYFNYCAGDIPEMGRWFIYGIKLPDDVLRKVYHINAERVLLHL